MSGRWRTFDGQQWSATDLNKVYKCHRAKGSLLERRTKFTKGTLFDRARRYLGDKEPPYDRRLLKKLASWLLPVRIVLGMKMMIFHALGFLAQPLGWRVAFFFCDEPHAVKWCSLHKLRWTLSARQNRLLVSPLSIVVVMILHRMLSLPCWAQLLLISMQLKDFEKTTRRRENKWDRICVDRPSRRVYAQDTTPGLW